MWNDNNKIMVIFDEIENGKTVYPCTCPACEGQTSHVYIHKHNDRHCGIWVWCSKCGAYSHMSGVAPKWWKNPDFIDPAQLCAEPEYLEQMKARIDEWVNTIVPTDVSKSNKPFVMESRFDVVFKEKLKNIPEGTIGTIVIKDDFKTMKIEFIGVDGKAVKLDESPNNLEKIVEVIKPSNNNQTPQM